VELARRANDFSLHVRTGVRPETFFRGFSLVLLCRMLTLPVMKLNVAFQSSVSWGPLVNGTTVWCLPA